MEPVDDNGYILMDYAIYNAGRAGFGTIVCVIAPEMKQDFREVIGDRIARKMELRIYLMQGQKVEAIMFTNTAELHSGLSQAKTSFACGLKRN